MAGTEFSDVLFGTPKPLDTEADLGVMNAENVNIVVHGHDPSLSEMICEYADDPEMIAYAKEMGAKGITDFRCLLYLQRSSNASWYSDGR